MADKTLPKKKPRERSEQGRFFSSKPVGLGLFWRYCESELSAQTAQTSQIQWCQKLLGVKQGGRYPSY